MSNPFFAKPILNSPYREPARHWELDDSGQPTQRILESRRRAKFRQLLMRGLRGVLGTRDMVRGTLKWRGHKEQC